MNGTSPAKLVEIVKVMSETALLNILSRMSLTVVMQIPTDVLFQLLSKIPAENLIKEIPPEMSSGSTMPTVESETDTAANYVIGLLVQWGLLTPGTPHPIVWLKIKVAETVRNVQTMIRVLTNPAQASQVPAGGSLSLDEPSQRRVRMGVRKV